MEAATPSLLISYQPKTKISCIQQRIYQGKKMRSPRFLALVLVSALVFLSFSQGYGRRIRVMRHYWRWHSPELLVHQENSGIEREMMEMEMDYREPGANTNTRSGALLNSPTSPPVPLGLSLKKKLLV